MSVRKWYGGGEREGGCKGVPAFSGESLGVRVFFLEERIGEGVLSVYINFFFLF
jgi:hypothetical protein